MKENISSAQPKKLRVEDAPNPPPPPPTDNIEVIDDPLTADGELELALGHLPEAIEDIERAIRLDPSYRHQYLQFLAMAHFLKGNFETAVVLLRERIFLVKDTDIGRAWLASALGHLGEIEQARSVWTEMIEINPTFEIRTRLANLTLADPSHEEMVLQGLSVAGVLEEA